MLSRTLTGNTVGINGHVVQVEVDVARGLPGLTIVGLPDTAVQESRERVRSAVRNSGFDYPLARITVNLAPADLRKSGGTYDLAIAIGVLAASEQVPLAALEGVVLVGELALDGSLRPVHGLLAMAYDLARTGHRSLVVPELAGPEAAMIPDLDVRGARSLAQVVDHLRGTSALTRAVPSTSPARETGLRDLADVRGQLGARRALEIAAAGGHNLLLVGPPGTGKSMLASRLPGLLPDLSFEEGLEVSRLHSVSGLLAPGQPLIRRPPYRSPHHTASDVALVGGGRIPRPGEVSLAHRGVLFLDELPEFRRSTLECLRQPLTDGIVTVSRAAAHLSFPARFQLLAAMNPCPCGFLGDRHRVCRCSRMAHERYRARVSGPLIDRIDMHVEVSGLPGDLLDASERPEASEPVRRRVVAARALAASRDDGAGAGTPNGQKSRAHLQRLGIADKARRELVRAVAARGLSARAHDRVLRVARTIADLGGQASIEADHVAEAMAFRCMDGPAA